MVAICAAFGSRRLASSAGVGFSKLSRRTFISTPSLRANESNSNNTSKNESTASSPQQPSVTRGSLGSGSIFSDISDTDDFVKQTVEGRAPRRAKSSQRNSDNAASAASALSSSLADRDMSNLDRQLNPHPDRRAGWHRKMVIRSVKRQGRLSKKDLIMQTERELLSKSHFFKTSVKKLGPLARQIAGKNIDEAILQMRFSKKKAAQDLKAFLEQARNEAIVARGMGIGLGLDQVAAPPQEAEEVVEEKQEQEQDQTQEQQDGQEGQLQVESGSGEAAAESSSPSAKPLTIKLKDGKRHTITDPTSIYIAQAWVNRGPYGRDFDHRARGNINIMKPPHTGISLVLKEEKTRIREWQDREAKELRQRKSMLWVPLPDRKIVTQNQYYSW